MLSHQVTRQGSRRHHLYVLPAENLSLQSLPVRGALPRDPPPIRRIRLISRRLSGAADHADFLPDIGPQAQPIK